MKTAVVGTILPKVVITRHQGTLTREVLTQLAETTLPNMSGSQSEREDFESNN
jgi:lactate dehydrogenase-like 2-hydroxyacid dehydrogenase